LFDPDFFAAASSFGHRDAQRWVAQHPDLWRTEGLPDPGNQAPR
jgi:NTE family protein